MSQVVKEPEAKVAAPASESATPGVTSPQSTASAPVQPVQPVQQQPTAPQPTPAGPVPVYGVPVYGVPVAAPSRSNGLSIAAMVCGIVGIVFAFIPVLGAPIGIVLGVLATVMGAIGVRKAISKGMGITGLVLGILSLLLSIGWLLIPLILSAGTQS